MEDNLTFSAALVRLKKGDSVARDSWENDGVLTLNGNDISLGVGELSSGVTSISVEDILADDWRVVKEAD